MPYPVVHLLFFVFCASAVAIYALAKSASRKELSRRNIMQILLLLFVGSAATMFPDSIIVHSLLVNGNMEHCWIGPVPTHSFIFSSTALLFGISIGYIVYRKFSKAIYLGLFAESAFLFHVLLDDVFEEGFVYFYPIYNEPISLISLMDVGFQNTTLTQYLGISFVSVFFVCSVIMMSLFSLDKFGFEFSYSEKELENN
ncbi:MAG: metal-dependent hydrolase [Methanosarcina sp.]